MNVLPQVDLQVVQDVTVLLKCVGVGIGRVWAWKSRVGAGTGRDGDRIG